MKQNILIVTVVCIQTQLAHDAREINYASLSDSINQKRTDSLSRGRHSSRPSCASRAVSCSVVWDRMRCSMDYEPVTSGFLPPEQIGRFPWLGVIQHDFFEADKMRYFISGAVVIHPGYALAAAEDMAKIDKGILRNSTSFIVWYSAKLKYTLEVEDYYLNTEFEGLTYATTALVKLARDGTIELKEPGPIMQICMPIKGGGRFGNIYAIKVTDDYGEFQKEVTQMDLIEVNNCDLYDEKAEPEQKMLVPTYPICAAPQGPHITCFMESGTVLVSRESDAYWTLLGFGVRAPTCSSPARFIYLQSQMQWIDSLIPT